MGFGGVVGLVPMMAVLLMVPGARANCGEREYFHEDRCCVFCEAGTFVADHCSASHLRGKCEPCKEGKDFAAHENGLEGCLPCRQCKEGQVTVRPCTLTQDTECQCERGHFCADEGCEICQRYNQMYPDGKGIVSNSTDITDPGLTSQGNGVLVGIILVILVVVVLVLLIVFAFKKLKSDKAASTDKDEEGGLVQEPSQIIVKDLSQSELRETFDVFIKEVPPVQWMQLMETFLQGNDIDQIISKFPDNREEQSYQMLLIWRNRLGKKQCIINLLAELNRIDTEVYYNILNTLKSSNIIS